MQGRCLKALPLVCVRDLPPASTLLHCVVLHKALTIRVQVQGCRGDPLLDSHLPVQDPVLCVQACGEVMRSWQLVTHLLC